MAVIFFFGFGFAALRNGGAIWASVTFSVAIISFSVAVIGAWSRKEKDRMSWRGFAIAAGVALSIWILTPHGMGSSQGPPRPLLFYLQPYVQPDATGGAKFIYFIQIATSLEIILLGLVGAFVGHFLALRESA
jgi:multisubunit Na+/H+ antiporter MnhB subunit